jgi:hypothetical protein
MNTLNGTETNIGIDTSQKQLDIYVRPSGEFFSYPNRPLGAGEALRPALTSLKPEKLRLISDLIAVRKQCREVSIMQKNRLKRMPKS